ncbi:hypothetical protein C8R43DRAFT_982090 [Mycena crocata]|nr:hypothetical protein C8R43DRAFT_982090 [Mycena crocata]
MELFPTQKKIQLGPKSTRHGYSLRRLWLFVATLLRPSESFLRCGSQANLRGMRGLSKVCNSETPRGLCRPVQRTPLLPREPPASTRILNSVCVGSTSARSSIALAIAVRNYFIVLLLPSGALWVRGTILSTRKSASSHISAYNTLAYSGSPSPPATVAKLTFRRHSVSPPEEAYPWLAELVPLVTTMGLWAFPSFPWLCLLRARDGLPFLSLGPPWTQSMQ